MKRILKSELDKFYTKINIANYLINLLDIDSFDLVIEPSCGSGSFYNQINHNNKIGIDIAPEIDGVITHDFLTFNINTENKKVLMIGNPPFGKQGSLAMKFINKSAEYSDKIAFILPLSFMKDSVKNRIPDFFHLTYEERLDENSFELNGEDYPVKCCFQIWEKRNYKREKIKKIEPINFSYTKNKNDADISVRRVGVYAGKAFNETNKSEQSHYFLILNNKSQKELFIETLNLHEWSDLTVGPRSISKSELNNVLNQIRN
jgi:predicted RNA methylase